MLVLIQIFQPINSFKMKKKSIKVALLNLGISVMLSSCITTARISNFSDSASAINFEQYATEYKSTATPYWMSQKENEYYFEVNKLISKEKITNLIELSLLHFNYSIKKKNVDSNCYVGKKGMGLNEWRILTGIYFKQENDITKVYIQSKITQDITGGIRENRALKIGQYLEAQLKVN